MFELHRMQDALFLDIDGTLIDIALTPDGIVVPHQLVKDLAQLHSRMGGALALISGRSIEDIDYWFAPLRLPAAGGHGAEWRFADTCPVHSVTALPEDIRHSVAQTFRLYPDIYCQDKVYNIAVHYRKVPELAGLVEQTLQEAAASSPLPLRVLRGKMVCELLGETCSKGRALERFMNQPPFHGRRPLFLGDDITDIDAMEACVRLGGVAGQVGQVSYRFEMFFESPEQVRDWIRKNV